MFQKMKPGDSGCVGKAGARLRDNDSIEEVMHVMDHDHILFFTSDGIVRSRRAFQLPQGSRTSGGTPITQACPCPAVPNPCSTVSAHMAHAECQMNAYSAAQLRDSGGKASSQHVSMTQIYTGPLAHLPALASCGFRAGVLGGFQGYDACWFLADSRDL